MLLFAGLWRFILFLFKFRLFVLIIPIFSGIIGEEFIEFIFFLNFSFGFWFWLWFWFDFRFLRYRFRLQLRFYLNLFDRFSFRLYRFNRFSRSFFLSCFFRSHSCCCRFFRCDAQFIRQGRYLFKRLGPDPIQR